MALGLKGRAGMEAALVIEEPLVVDNTTGRHQTH